MRFVAAVKVSLVVRLVGGLGVLTLNSIIGP